MSKKRKTIRQELEILIERTATLFDLHTNLLDHVNAIKLRLDGVPQVIPATQPSSEQPPADEPSADEPQDDPDSPTFEQALEELIVKASNAAVLMRANGLTYDAQELLQAAEYVAEFAEHTDDPIQNGWVDQHGGP